MLEIVQYKDLFSDFFYDSSWKSVAGDALFSKPFPVTLGKKTQLVPSTLSDQNTNLAARHFRHVNSLPPRHILSYLAFPLPLQQSSSSSSSALWKF